jgi:hypothetical protein
MTRPVPINRDRLWTSPMDLKQIGANVLGLADQS